jgi:hypothetical protein
MQWLRCTGCGSVGLMFVYQRFGRTYCFYLQTESTMRLHNAVIHKNTDYMLTAVGTSSLIRDLLTATWGSFFFFFVEVNLCL